MRRCTSLFLLVVILGSLLMVFVSRAGQGLVKDFAKASRKAMSSSGGHDPPKLPPKGSEKVLNCSHESPPCLEGSGPLIYFVTPTYPRREQVAELTRLAQTLLHVHDLHWILAEDASSCSTLIPSVLQRYDISYTHLATPIPSIYSKLPKQDIPRGVSARRASLARVLDWHSNSCPPDRGGVIYFADDDNSYDIRLFREVPHLLV